MISRALILLALAIGPAAQAGDAECADRAERGQELRDARKLVEAREAFVACAQKQCPSVVRVSCTEWLADVERRVPSLVVGARDADGKDLRCASVTLDGVSLPETVASSAVRANPGDHVVGCLLQGKLREERVVLGEGEAVRVVRFALSRPIVLPPAAPPPPPRRGLSPLALIVGGAGVLALGVSGYFGLRGASEYGRLESTCAPDCARSDIDAVRTQLLVADVALVTGVIALGSAVLIQLFHRGAER